MIGIWRAFQALRSDNRKFDLIQTACTASGFIQKSCGTVINRTRVTLAGAFFAASGLFCGMSATCPPSSGQGLTEASRHQDSPGIVELGFTVAQDRPGSEPMTCCIVGLLILSVVGRLRRAVGGPVDEPVLFAPVARRAAPGQTLPEPLTVSADPGPALRGKSSPVLRYCALGITVCLVGYPLLAHTGVVTNTGSTFAWLMRSGLYLVALVAAVMLSRSNAIWRASSGAGTLLIVVGAVIVELGTIDMHVFRLFTVDSANMLALMVFHNAGPALAMIGGVVLLRGAAGRRSASSGSSRSTVTSAWPASSAVKVSSIPPVTT